MPVFPTHVGVFPPGDGPSFTDIGLPHARGGVSSIEDIIPRKKESSPRTWGCFLGQALGSGRGDVFLTHVGVFPATRY